MSQSDLKLSEKSAQVQKMFDKIAKRYDFLNRLLSAGQDQKWRLALIDSLPVVEDKQGILCDIACGTGDILFAVLNRRSDYTTLMGFDLSSGMLEQAEKRKNEQSIAPPTHVSFTQANAESIPYATEKTHCVTIAFGLRNIDNREKSILEFQRLLRPGGTLLVLDFFPAENTAMAKAFDIYFKNVLPKIGGLFSDRNAYEYLPKSVQTMPKADDFCHLLEDSGFQNIREEESWLAGAVRLFAATKAG